VAVTVRAVHQVRTTYTATTAAAIHKSQLIANKVARVRVTCRCTSRTRKR
jgi:hypothetical protein